MSDEEQHAAELAEVRSERDALAAENAELRRDAERYREARNRVSRSRSVVPPVNGLEDDFEIRLPFVFECGDGMASRFDAAVDAAIAAGK